MKRINCYGTAIEGCVTKYGTLVAPLMTELVGFKRLTPYKGGWCGNEIYPNAFNADIPAPEPTKLVANKVLDVLFHVRFADCIIDVFVFPINI